MEQIQEDQRALSVGKVSVGNLREVLEELSRDGKSGPGAIVDCHATLSRLEGDWELFRDLLGFFFQDARGLKDLISQAVEAHSSERLAHSAHQFKGLVSNFDAHHLVAAAARLEFIGKSGDLVAAPKVLAELERTYQEVDGVLGRFCQPS